MNDPTRRRFLFSTGVTSVVLSACGFLGATARYLSPNVLYEPPHRFPIGSPEEFPPGTATFLPEHRLFLFNNPAGFYAISSVCTHLGCNVRHIVGEGFACPCHGSRFDENGQVVHGPAPEPLAWFGLSLSPRRELVVNTRQPVQPEYRFRV
ncbi:MAG: Rieske 2Fe-2S domain-containing protein [Acidobacteria bacterium]|nr:Rieske 2Fe-2S domain-containing protein [Acidobacteriota bacterium]